MNRDSSRLLTNCRFKEFLRPRSHQTTVQAPTLRKPSLPVLRDGGVGPRCHIQIQPDKPAKDQVASQLTHQGSFGGHAQQIPAQERQTELLGRNRRATGLGIERGAKRPDSIRIDQRPDLPHEQIEGVRPLCFVLARLPSWTTAMTLEDYWKLQATLVTATQAMLKPGWDKVKDEAVRGDLRPKRKINS